MTAKKLGLPILGAILMTLLFSSFNMKSSKDSYHVKFKLPGMVKINDVLFCDETEVTNIHWREYMHWTKRVFGEESKEYNATHPDTTVWTQKANNLTYCSEYYFRHPSFNYYPIVGISQQQAAKYSKWRSDRVFEYILIVNGILKPDLDQTSTMHFTIEGYLKGDYKNMKPDARFTYYPNYRLPTLLERDQILTHTDSLNKAYFNNCNSKYCKECKSNYPDMQVGVNPIKAAKSSESPVIPTRPVSTDCVSKKQPFYNLRGNVSEWTNENEICVGGGWADTKARTLSKDTFRLENRNAWTGFRNVCDWKKWGS